MPAFRCAACNPIIETPLVHKWNFVIQRELKGNVSIEVGYEGNHQAKQLILWNSDPYPNLGTFNTAISSASLQEIQPACSTCQSVGNGLSMTSSFGVGNYAAGSVKVEKRYSHGLNFLSLLRVESCAGGWQYATKRRYLDSGSDQLHVVLFQRVVGHPAQPHQRGHL